MSVVVIFDCLVLAQRSGVLVSWVRIDKLALLVRAALGHKVSRFA